MGEPRTSTAEFEDIRIVDLDLSRTTWSRVHDSLRVMFLRLDRLPPDNDWPRLFFEEREMRIVARRRGLWIEDGYISFDTLPEEVETIHLPDIRQSLAYANRHYRALAAQRRQQQQENLSGQRSERDALLALQQRVRLLLGDADTASAIASGTGAAVTAAAPPAVATLPARAPADAASPAPPMAATAAERPAASAGVAVPPVDALTEFQARSAALKQMFRTAVAAQDQDKDKEQK